MHSSVVQWPNEVQREETNQYYNERYGIPGLIGIIDGTHAKGEQKIDFTDRKSTYSVNLTVIINEKERIIASNYGQPGRESDSAVYHLMNVYKNSVDYFNDNEYLIGDKAYGLSKNMITPFKGINSNGRSGKSFF